MSRVTAVSSATLGSLVTQGQGGDGQEPDEEEQQGKKKKKKKPAAAKSQAAPAAASNRDTLERRRAPAGVPTMGSALGAGLAVEGEGQAPIAQQLGLLQKRLAEAENGFEFMGKGHPSYEKTRLEVERLRDMVKTLGG